MPKRVKRISRENSLPDAGSDLILIVNPGAGFISYRLDLTDLAIGGSLLKRSGESFIGRPTFARQIADTFRLAYQPSNQGTAGTALLGVRFLFHYLDSCNEAMPAQCLEELNNLHAIGFTRWLDVRPDQHRAAALRPLLDAASALHGLEPLFWDMGKAHRPPSVDVPTSEQMRDLFRALCDVAKNIKRTFCEGESLATSGVDPRIVVRERRHGVVMSPGTEWNSSENQAWFFKRFMHPILQSGNALKTIAGNDSIFQYGGLGPSFRVPGSHVPQNGFASNLTWFFLGVAELRIFLSLFQLGTGWDLGTILSLDIDDWVSDFPLKPNLKVLRSGKRRAGNRLQYALSGANSEFRPYQIMKFLIERSAPLRATLAVELESTQRRIADGVASEHDAFRLQVLSRNIKSPWLFVPVQNLAHPNALTSSDPPTSLLDDVVDAYQLRDENGHFLKFNAKNIRRGWADFNYSNGGYQWIMARIALGHTNARSLHHYLASLRLHRRGTSQVRHYQDALFGEIAQRRVVDGAVLRILVSEGTITDEQRERLADRKNRSRVGLGCVDPFNPPKLIAPEHQAGCICRIQRCTLCAHGVVFPESVDGLSRRLAELLEIQRTTPTETWLKGDFGDEITSTRLALDLLADPESARLIEKYTLHFRKNPQTIVDFDGAY